MARRLQNQADRYCLILGLDLVGRVPAVPQGRLGPDFQVGWVYWVQTVVGDSVRVLLVGLVSEGWEVGRPLGGMGVLVGWRPVAPLA